MRPPLRIAVLECDEPIGRTKEKYGGYGGLFKELLENGAQQLAEKPELDVTKFDVVNTEHYPKLENVDAILLSGSRKSPPSQKRRRAFVDQVRWLRLYRMFEQGIIPSTTILGF